MNKNELLIFMAKRAGQMPNLIASLITAYCEIEHLSWESVAEQLAITPEQLASLALCGRPEKPPKLQADVEKIAAYVGMPLLPLMRFVKKAETLEAFNRKSGTSTLMAARDRTDDE